VWGEGDTRLAKPQAARFQPTWYPGTLDTDNATALVLAPGQQLSGLEIRLQRASVHRIRGHASGLENIPAFPDRGPFASRSVSAYPVSQVGGGSYSGILRPDGSFEIQYLPSGSYEVLIQQGFPPIELGYATVEVGDRDVEDVNIDLVAPRPLNGKLQVESGNPNLSGLRVALIPADGGILDQAAVSPADGSFRFALVGARRYRITVRSDPANAFYIKRIRYGDSVSTDHTVTISGADGELLVTIGADGATIMARVTEANGRQTGVDLSASPPPATQVVLIPEGPFDEARVAAADQHGVFTLGNLAPGLYKVYAFQDVPDGSWEDPDFVKEIRSRGVAVQLKEGDVARVEVPLLRKADLAPILQKLGLE